MDGLDDIVTINGNGERLGYDLIEFGHQELMPSNGGPKNKSEYGHFTEVPKS